MVFNGKEWGWEETQEEPEKVAWIDGWMDGWADIQMMGGRDGGKDLLLLGPGCKERVLNSKIGPRGPWAEDPYLNLPGLDSFYHLPGLAL